MDDYLEVGQGIYIHKTQEILRFGDREVGADVHIRQFGFTPACLRALRLLATSPRSYISDRRLYREAYDEIIENDIGVGGSVRQLRSTLNKALANAAEFYGATWKKVDGHFPITGNRSDGSILNLPVKDCAQAETRDAVGNSGVINGFDTRDYVDRLAALSYFDGLCYRDAQGGNLNVNQFVERTLVRGDETLPLSSLVDFERQKTKLLTACGGEGKTSSLIALTRSFGCNGLELRERMGFDAQNDERLNQIPFFFSFNPGRNYGRPELIEGTYNEILDNLMSGMALPLRDELEQIIKTLGRDAFFILDALDEAEDLNLAMKAVLSLRRAFPDAGLVVATRPLTSLPTFANDDVAYRLDALTDEQKLSFAERHIADCYSNLEPTRDEVARCAKELITGKYTKDMMNVPVFASVASRSLRFNPTNRSFRTIVPHSVYKTVHETLLGKAVFVLERWRQELDDGNHEAITPTNEVSCQIRTRRIMDRLALVSFLGSKLNRKLSPAYGDITEEASLVEGDAISWEAVKCIMRKISSDYSFPEQRCDDKMWRHYLIASGFVSCQPNADGGVFSFDNRDMQLFMAACGLFDLIRDRRHGDCFGILGDLLSSCPDNEAMKVTVMLLACLDPGQSGMERAMMGDINCEIIGNSLEVCNCLLYEISQLGKNDQEKRHILTNTLKSIQENEFENYNLLRFRSGGPESGPRLYADMLKAELDWLEDVADGDPQ